VLFCRACVIGDVRSVRIARASQRPQSSRWAFKLDGGMSAPSFFKAGKSKDGRQANDDWRKSAGMREKVYEFESMCPLSDRPTRRFVNHWPLWWQIFITISLRLFYLIVSSWQYYDANARDARDKRSRLFQGDSRLIDKSYVKTLVPDTYALCMHKCTEAKFNGLVYVIISHTRLIHNNWSVRVIDTLSACTRAPRRCISL